MTAAAGTALSILTGFVSESLAPEEAEVWLQFASIIDADGLLDGLTEQDAKGVVAVTLFDLRELGADGLWRRAEWIETTDQGREPLHDPAAVVTAIRRVAELADMKW